MLAKSSQFGASLGARLNSGGRGGLNSGAGGNSVVVNGRNLGARGQMSQNFGANSGGARERMQLRQLQMKAQSAAVQSNPVELKRVQQQIAIKAASLYGVDAKALMGSGRAGGMNRQINTSNFATTGGSAGTSFAAGNSRPAGGQTSDHYGLASKINGRAA
ncbi:hypothetical protein IJJ12_02825 [bacterium]|nr:hypothetical protein [bacterium]